MKPIVYALIIALSLAVAPRVSNAGAAAPAPTAKTCFFVRNHLPCPCGRGREARALAHAAVLTAGALKTAVGTTTAALVNNPRNASTQPKR